MALERQRTAKGAALSKLTAVRFSPWPSNGGQARESHYGHPAEGALTLSI